MSEGGTPQTDALRVVIQQPVLPKYRVPVFNELARRPGIDLTVYYGDRTDSPPSVEELPGYAQFSHLHEARVFGVPVLWHWPQWRAASRRVCDVLVLSWDIHYASLIPALLRARVSGVRTVLWGHGYSKRESGWRSRLRRSVARLADALVFYNHAAARSHLDAGFDAHRVFVALNAIDQTSIQAARGSWLSEPGKLDQFRRDHRLDGGPVILFVSRMDRANRLDLLVEALPRLVAHAPGVQCVIIGKGDDERARLQGLADEHGVSDRLRFLGPIYNEQEVAPWFLAADVFCYPANIGLSILHAFGYGLPVVTSDRIEAQNPEIEALRHDENGLLYSHGSAEALADALCRLIQDPTTRQRLGDEAHRTATELFTLENMADGMQAAILNDGHRAGAGT